MDWSKARNVMIIALIITNIFLGYTYIEKNYSKNKMMDNMNFKAAIAQRGIKLETELPQGKAKMPSLVLTYDEPSKDLEAEFISSGKYNLGKAKAKAKFIKASDEIVEKLGYLLTDFVSEVTSDVKENEICVTYYSTYNGYPIHAQPLQVIFENGKLSKIQGRVTVAIPSSKKNLSVISAEEAMLIFLRENAEMIKNDKTTEVVDVQLVFWASSDSIDGGKLISDTAFPTWLILTKNAGNIYIEANRI